MALGRATGSFVQTIPFDHPELRITGALDFDRSNHGITPRRLPAWTRPQVPPFMELMVTQPSGVRLEFATDAETIELEVLLTRMELIGVGAHPAVFDLVVDGELRESRRDDGGALLRLDLRRPGRPEVVAGASSTLRFDGLGAGGKRCELWLPTNATVELRALRLSAGSRLWQPAPLMAAGEPAPADVGASEGASHAETASHGDGSRRRWLHYGSSISHCLEASSPTRSWPALAARLAGVDLRSFAFAGNCHLDPFVARAMAEQQADLISLKVGINVVNMDAMRERTFTPALHGFLDTIREQQPDTPILLISPIFCPSAEDRPGPTFPDGRGRFVTVSGNDELRAGCLTLRWIRRIMSELAAARRKSGDDALHYLDGLTLLGPDDARHLPDDLHPDGAGYELLGRRFHEAAFVDGPFAASSISRNRPGPS